MSKLFSREQLYEEIWAISARGVATKYNLDYPKLLVVCKNYDIPVPSPKYYSYVRMGRDLTDLVVPLPPFDQDEIQVSE